jgi:choline dehydrogenase-like flavoprotein
MFIDAEQLEDRTTIESQILIVGGGMAGITLARQLGDAGLDVAILEGGGEKPDDRTQSLYAGTMTIGDGQDSPRRLDEYLTSSRVRCFGGSGNVWGGKCGPLDPMDFERRAWVPYSGWPISRFDLQPFYDRASALLELPAFPPPGTRMAGGAEPLFGARSPMFTPRTRTYTRYTGALPDGPYRGFKDSAARHPRVRVYLNANVSAIRASVDGRRIESVEVRGFSGRRHTARGLVCVLATGGIENVRLLLASNHVHRSGIGNHSGWLGCGFQGHTTISREHTSLWAMRSTDDLAPYNNTMHDRPHTVLGASDEAQRHERRLNFTVTIAGRTTKPSASTAAVRAVARRLSQAPVDAHHGIYFMVEHPPNRDSRITLKESDRDPLGMPRVRLDMRHSSEELDTLERSVAALAGELGRLEAGRLQWAGTRADWLQSLASLSRHHMGATRMSTSRVDGVVDEHCRVHGVENLYVAGSSVFPTSGIANPTLTLLALALRMGDHLIAARGRTQ